MYKVRTAKRQFTDSFGQAVKPGEVFVIIEPRAVFCSRRWLEEATAKLKQEPRGSKRER